MQAVRRSKPHREFFRIALQAGADGEGTWAPVPGHPGIEEMILADNLDAAARCGSRTRLARWRPGTCMPSPVVHDFHEEVFVVSGDLVVGCDAHGRGGERFDAPTFACRPPGVLHGPFTTSGGCVLLEFQYFA
ncbi:MAG: cupin domain-containing protein [Burkholderiales bacterium]|nr:cupin domain-containing protein [Burkholderiales bacterium]